MKITFNGATREVTGSMFVLSNNNDHLLLDCGLFQGHRKESTEKNRQMKFDPGIITNVILSHAHIDHFGRLPLLTKNGFEGRIFCTRATAAACRYLLPDSAHIQESDAAYLNYKSVRSVLSETMTSRKSEKLSNRRRAEIKKLLKNKHQLNLQKIAYYARKYHVGQVEPLYSIADAENTLAYFDDYPYREPVTVGKQMTCTFYEAGHILGSAMNLIKIKNNGIARRILYTGDIGRFDTPILKNPCLNFDSEDREIDLMIMESTYGNKTHGAVTDLKGQLEEVLTETFNRGGTVLIPAFAFGRTQTLLYLLHELYNENRVYRAPVYVDSPLATKLTQVFGEHPEVYDSEAHEAFLSRGLNPFQFKELRFVASVEESMVVNRQDGPQVVIAASGMCEAGRILHHLRYKIHNPKNAILLVGYMAQHTLGRRIEEQGLAYMESADQEPPPLLRFMNKEYPLKARVYKIDGFSAHADKHELLYFLRQSNLKIKMIALVHGEEEQSLPFASTLKKLGYSVFVPRCGETQQIN